MATEKQINKNNSKDPLSANLFEILEHIKQTKVNLKCDVCKCNAAVILCTNCTLCLCKVCHKRHSEENNEHDIVPLDKASRCLEHNENHEYYCKNCNEYACSGCKVKHSSGDNHNLGIIKEITLKHRNLLAKITAPIDEINETLSQTETKLITAQKELEEQLTTVKQNIDNQYDVQFEKLKKRHDQLKMKLSPVVSQKQTILLAHLEKIKSTQNEVISLVKKLFDDLKLSSNQKVISTQEPMMEFYVQKINSQLKSLSSEPVGSDLITFDPVAESAEILGQLCTEVNLSEIKHLSKFVTNDETFEFLILTKDKRNQCCTEGGSQVSIKLISSTGKVTTGKVRDNNDGSYTVSMKAEEIGEAKLSACIDGLNIKGSPFSIEVIRSQAVLTEIVNCDGNPWGIALAKNDKWAVTDNTNHCVYIFNGQNQLVHTFGRKGSEKGEFNHPRGLAFDSNDHLYVVDGGNHRVQKFDTTGKYLLEFGTEGNGNGQLWDPFGITTHKDKVFVADFLNNRISVFQTEGQFYFCFGSDHLSGPRDVAIGNNNQLFVADYYNHRICIFTVYGGYSNEFGKLGNHEGDLKYPFSVATTWNEQIVITDKNLCVSLFRQNGQYVRCLGYSLRVAKGQISYPHGVASKSNSIYVTDLVNQRVQIFNLPI